MRKQQRILKRAACFVLMTAVLISFMPQGFGRAQTAEAASVKSIRSAAALRSALTSSESGAYRLSADISGVTKAIVVKSKTKSLDLNGYSVKGKDRMTGLITVKGGKLTISDSKGGGQIRNTDNQDAVGCESGTLIINGGSFRGKYYAMYNTGGRTTINGGSFRGAKCGVKQMKGKLKINGGSLKGEDGLTLAGNTKTSVRIAGGSLQGTHNGCTASGGKLIISGGSFAGEKSCGVAGFSGKYGTDIIISGGTFNGYDALAVQGDLNLTVTGGSFTGSHTDLTIYNTFRGDREIDESLFANIWDDSPAGHGVYETEFKWVPVTYTEGMTVSDADTLYSLYVQVQDDLLPKFKIRATEHLYEVLNVYGLAWSPSVSTQTNTAIENGIADIEVQFRYPVEFEVERLIRDQKVKANASAEAVKYYKKICAITKTAVKGCETKKEKVKAINKYMIRNYAYDYQYRQASYSFTGLLDNKKAVCQGFAELFRMMGLQAGIETQSIGGMATSGPGKTDFETHMWNRSKIGGKWYYTDVTYNEGTGTNKFLLLSKKNFYGKGYHYLL